MPKNFFPLIIEDGLFLYLFKRVTLIKQLLFELFISSMERTLIMIKPDGVQRGLKGEIINRFK